MIFAAAILTDPAAQDAAARAADIFNASVISSVATAGLGIFFVWLRDRRKTNSDIGVNESVIIQNSRNTIAGLAKDLDSFIEQVRVLRDQVESVQAEKVAADKLIDEVKATEAAKVEALNRSFIDEKERIGKTVDRGLEIIQRLQSKVADRPDAVDAKRDAVMLMEILYFTRRQLTGR